MAPLPEGPTMPCWSLAMAPCWIMTGGFGTAKGAAAHTGSTHEAHGGGGGGRACRRHTRRRRGGGGVPGCFCFLAKRARVSTSAYRDPTHFTGITCLGTRGAHPPRGTPPALRDADVADPLRCKAQAASNGQNRTLFRDIADLHLYGPVVHCNSGGGGGLQDLGEGGVWKTGARGRALFVPISKKKTGGEPDLLSLSVKSRISAISDVRWCFWWPGPWEPH